MTVEFYKKQIIDVFSDTVEKAIEYLIKEIIINRIKFNSVLKPFEKGLYKYIKDILDNSDIGRIPFSIRVFSTWSVNTFTHRITVILYIDGVSVAGFEKHINDNLILNMGGSKHYRKHNKLKSIVPDELFKME